MTPNTLVRCASINVGHEISTKISRIKHYRCPPNTITSSIILCARARSASASTDSKAFSGGKCSARAQGGEEKKISV